MTKAEMEAKIIALEARLGVLERQLVLRQGEPIASAPCWPPYRPNTAAPQPWPYPVTMTGGKAVAGLVGLPHNARMV